MKKIDINKEDKFLVLNSEPAGNNSSTALSAFYQEKLYEIKSFSQPLITENKPINILYEKQHYGRVDLDNIPVIIKETQTKTVSIGSKQIILHNFVHDAYKELISYWDYLKKINKLKAGGVYQDIKIKNDDTTSGKLYFYYLNEIYKQFAQTTAEQNIIITDFNHFLKNFLGFLDGLMPFMPFLYSSFIVSRMADPLITGLCFDVNRSDPANDSEKYSSYLQDPNFAIFKKTATKFGFFVDKQIPWRLWADVDSPAMAPYMQKYNINQDTLYKTNFITADSYDLVLLKTYLVQFYNTYVSSNSTKVKPDFKICGDSTIIKNKFINTDFLVLADLVDNKDFDRIILSAYVFLKARENNLNWDQSTFKNVEKTFIMLKERLDTDAALRYIRPITIRPAAASQKNRNYNLNWT
jgi:hypothetical protein